MPNPAISIEPLHPFMVTDESNTPLCIIASTNIIAAQAETDDDSIAELFGVKSALVRPLTFTEMMTKYKRKTIFEHAADIHIPQRIFDFNH